jgi:hypothetical protein
LTAVLLFDAKYHKRAGCSEKPKTKWHLALLQAPFDAPFDGHYVMSQVVPCSAVKLAKDGEF